MAVSWFFFISADEFSKIKDGVPPHLVDEHMKTFKQAVKDGKTVDPKFGLEKTSIAEAVTGGRSCGVNYAYVIMLSCEMLAYLYYYNNCQELVLMFAG